MATPDDTEIDATEAVRSLMHACGISSFRELSRRAEVSLWQVQQLRSGKIGEMRLAPLLKLSECLQVSLPELIDAVSPESVETSISQHQGGGGDRPLPVNPDLETQIATLQHEYDRLQQHMGDRQHQAVEELMRSALNQIESWMLQWPTAAYAAQKNDQIPASRLLPLVRPIENLLQAWGVEAIAPVGEEIPYDPQWHQLMDGTAQPGDRVRVRYVGYRLQGKLLHRAKVSPIS